MISEKFAKKLIELHPIIERRAVTPEDVEVVARFRIIHGLDLSIEGVVESLADSYRALNQVTATQNMTIANISFEG